MDSFFDVEAVYAPDAPLLLLEQRAFVENEDQKRRHEEDLHDLRKKHTALLFRLTFIWVAVVWFVVLLQGFGRWFLPFFLEGYRYIPFKLSDSVLIAFITSTTATVLGLYGVAAYWLFGKQRAKEEKKKEGA
ncbi:hypothetical protein [Pseudomonas oryzihabitans]|uniref:hypothetical protein n=1 Tax=Pseudomonas oryzihabitans TaxID=47885 RepID=UPI0011A2A2C1|nr:hypothetical protein [Pseudomonas psychrotolerans]